MPRKYWVDVVLIPLLILVLLYFRLIDYGLRQLMGQLCILANAVPVSEVLTDTTVSSAVKMKLRFIREVEEFGEESLGLSPTENYGTYFDQHGDPLLWVVTASAPYRLEPFTWTFPFLGKVSYKGFFDEGHAIRQADQLRSFGYDVYAYEVSAWSTLGWFRDPVLSGMLERGYGQLAELILHELTHATVYLSSNVDYNENLASFVGEQGALYYLKERYGDTSAVYMDYLNQLTDDRKLTLHFVSGAALLDSLYRSPVFINAGNDRARLKQKMLDEIILAMDTLSLSDTTRRKKMMRREWNNARFLSYLRYDAQKDALKSAMIQLDHGDLRLFIQRVRRQTSN